MTRDVTPQQSVRREDDDELLGFVAPGPDASSWQALTVFGGLLGVHDDEADAQQQVRDIGLSSLAERWWIDLGDGFVQCCLIEASPERLVVVPGYYPWSGPPVTVPPGTSLQLTRPT